MKAMQAMTRNVVCVSEDDQLETARDLMQEWDIRHLPVTRGEDLVGIVSDRDVLMHLRQGDDGDWEVPEMSVGDVMTAKPLTCSPADTISHVATVMMENKIDSVPVLEDDGSLVGLITSSDLIELLKEKDVLDSSRTIPWSYQIRYSDRGGSVRG